MDYILLIREFRTAKGLTQEELARKADIKQSYISQLENNHMDAKSPTLRTMFKIAAALGTCPHVLIKYDIPCNQNCFDKCIENFFK